MRGILVSFEGCDGSGKSTTAKLVGSFLEKRGHKIHISHEPGAEQIGQRIRQLIIDEQMDPLTELFLFQAARVEHIKKIIKPFLKQGRIILCDRYLDSTLACQGNARGLPWEMVQSFNTLASQGIQADLTVLLKINPAKSLRRSKNRNRFEAEGVLYQNAVWRGFLKSRKQDPQRWLIVDAEKNGPNEIAQIVVKEIYHRFPRFK